MKKPVKLQPCPSCGGENIELHGYSSIHGDGFVVSCEDADCQVQGPVHRKERAAVDAWNDMPRRNGA